MKNSLQEAELDSHGRFVARSVEWNAREGRFKPRVPAFLFSGALWLLIAILAAWLVHTFR